MEPDSNPQNGDSFDGRRRKSILWLALVVSLILVAAMLFIEEKLAGVIVAFVTVPLALEIIAV
jgi:hypothetical protein